MSPLPSKPAHPAVKLVCSRAASVMTALTQTTARERIALCAVAGAFITLGAGGVSYQRAHRGTEPVASRGDASSAIALRPAPNADTPPTVEVAARGGDSEDAQTSAPPVVAPFAASASDATGDAATGRPSASDSHAPGAGGVPESAASGNVTTDTSKENGPLVVYVTGAVKRPGVYTFRSGDRLYHAVRAAGGFKASARQDALNLADRLEDGDQLYIPSRKSPAAAVDTAVTLAPLSPRRVAGGASARSFTPSVQARALARSLDTPPSFGNERARGRILGPVPPVAVVRVPVVASGGYVAGGGNAAGDGASGATEEPRAAAPAKFKNPGDGVVNLNTATAADLEKISGIGPAMAARILEYRAQIGRFNDPQQLMDVKGIGEKKFARMQPFIVVK